MMIFFACKNITQYATFGMCDFTFNSHLNTNIAIVTLTSATAKTKPPITPPAMTPP